MAFETDLLEYGDLFDGNPVVDAKVEELKDGARAELANLDAMGGAIAAIDYMKGRLVEANADRLGGIERGETVVVGVKQVHAVRTLAADGRGWRHHGRRPGGRAGPDRAASGLARLPQRRGGFARRWPSCARPRRKGATSCPPPSRRHGRAPRPANGRARCARFTANTVAQPASPRPYQTRPRASTISARPWDAVSDALGRRLKFLVGKPGLDGHSNGAEQIAFRARDCGMDIAYEGASA